MIRHVINNEVILSPLEISRLAVADFGGIRAGDMKLELLRNPCLPDPRFDAMPPIILMVRGAANSPAYQVIIDGTHRALGAIKHEEPVLAIVIRCVCRTLDVFTPCPETREIAEKLQKMYHMEKHECTPECAEVMAEEASDADNPGYHPKEFLHVDQ